MMKNLFERKLIKMLGKYNYTLLFDALNKTEDLSDIRFTYSEKKKIAEIVHTILIAKKYSKDNFSIKCIAPDMIDHMYIKSLYYYLKIHYIVKNNCIDFTIVEDTSSYSQDRIKVLSLDIDKFHLEDSDEYYELSDMIARMSAILDTDKSLKITGDTKIVKDIKSNRHLFPYGDFVLHLYHMSGYNKGKEYELDSLIYFDINDMSISFVLHSETSMVPDNKVNMLSLASGLFLADLNVRETLKQLYLN